MAVLSDHHFDFSPEFDVWHIPNRWANQETIIRFISHMTLPYISKVRQEMKPLSDYLALVIFDVFCGQSVKEIHRLLKEIHIYVAKVASNCTDKLESLDLLVNMPTKDHIRQSFVPDTPRKLRLNLMLANLQITSVWI